MGVGRAVSTIREDQVTSPVDDLTCPVSCCSAQEKPRERGLVEITSPWRELGMDLIYVHLADIRGPSHYHAAFCNLREHPHASPTI